jgi:hypothetical protein
VAFVSPLVTRQYPAHVETGAAVRDLSVERSLIALEQKHDRFRTGACMTNAVRDEFARQQLRGEAKIGVTRQPVEALERFSRPPRRAPRRGEPTVELVPAAGNGHGHAKRLERFSKER